MDYQNTLREFFDTMPLLNIWKAQPDELVGKTIQQILAFAGDGRLRDDSATCLELRAFLDEIDSEWLTAYVDQCLTQPFTDSGMVLQDLVNQIGKRLGFFVEFGRYRGVQNAIGFDGLWKTNSGNALVVEVKTTDTYQISLERAVAYRGKLIESNSITEANSSILYVVGRSDTGSFESQVRGSRHAWDIRLIGAESLIRLLKLRESMDDPAILEKIRSILRPTEYTRVDAIIDLVFTTTSEATKDDQIGANDKPIIESDSYSATPTHFREACFAQIAKALGSQLVKKSQAIYSSLDGKMGVFCGVSRPYQNPSTVGYWFGFHPGQCDALALYEKAYVGFGCGSPEHIVIIPFATFKAWLPSFNQTVLEDRYYWHVKFENLNGTWVNVPNAEFSRRTVTEYLI